MAAPGWIQETWRTYVGNATSVRDFRVQMRGSKTILAWSLYLAVLLTVGYFTYSSIHQLDRFMTGPASVQALLGSFFGTMMRVIAGAIVVIAPGLTAASIVGERQRKSFDLVFSAPVTPKYYLVGKMIGSYRYTIMLLVLSVPVVALSALLGGATWADILVCYFLLSMSGLLMTAIALLVSALVERLQAAIATSYLLVALYIFLSFSIAASFAFGGAFRSGPISEAPFLVTLNPFLLPEVYGTYSMVGAVQVPNWVFTGIFTLLSVRLLLLGAGSALSPYGSPETKSLRIQGLLYIALFTLLFVWFPSIGARRMGDGTFLTYILLILSALVPFIVSFGEFERKVTEYDGPWNWRRTFFGTPSGAGPYLMSVIGVIFVAGAFVSNYRGIGWDSFAAHFMHCAGVLTFFAGATRMICSGVGFARGRALSNVLIIGLVWVLPIFLTIAISASYASSGMAVGSNPAWLLWPLWPIAGDFSLLGLATYGIAGVVLGSLLWLRAEKSAEYRRRSQMPITGFQL